MAKTCFGGRQGIDDDITLPDDDLCQSELAASLSRTCPVLKRARKTVKLSNDLAREMRRLRRDLQRCQRCPLNQGGKGCPALEMFQMAIQQAIFEACEELGLSQ